MSRVACRSQEPHRPSGPHGAHRQGALGGPAGETPLQGQSTVTPSPPPGTTIRDDLVAPATGGLAGLPGYELLGELGRGGMGVVYKARQVKADRLVAVKVVLGGARADPDQIGRFRTEAEAAARLQHPNIAQVYEAGECNGLPFFSMEYCPGGSLEKQLRQRVMPARQAATLVETLSRAMHYAHLKGVIHRDLKPGNVLLGEAGAPKVTDFGLARKLEAEGRTVTGQVMGTPSYVAPEQAQGQVHQIGPRSDVYFLAAILDEALTGRPSFKASSVWDTLLQVCHDDPVPGLRPGGPPWSATSGPPSNWWPGCRTWPPPRCWIRPRQGAPGRRPHPGRAPRPQGPAVRVPRRRGLLRQPGGWPGPVRR